MLDTILSVATGGASGLLGTIISKGFSIFDNIQEEKKSQREHERTIEMHRLDAELRSVEHENEKAIAEVQAAAEIRAAAYGHDASYGQPSKWCTNVLRLVRPVLTFGLIILTGIIYFSATNNGKIDIESAVVFMLGASIAWWFGDRSMQSRKK
jgi:hypothetical protein